MVVDAVVGVVRDAVERIGAAVDRKGLADRDLGVLRAERHAVVRDEVDGLARLGGLDGQQEAGILVRLHGPFRNGDAQRHRRDEGREGVEAVDAAVVRQVLAVGKGSLDVDRLGEERVFVELLVERDGDRRDAVGASNELCPVVDADRAQHVAVRRGGELPRERLGRAFRNIHRFHDIRVGRDVAVHRHRRVGVLGVRRLEVDAGDDVGDVDVRIGGTRSARGIRGNFKESFAVESNISFFRLRGNVAGIRIVIERVSHGSVIGKVDDFNPVKTIDGAIEDIIVFLVQELRKLSRFRSAVVQLFRCHLAEFVRDLAVQEDLRLEEGLFLLHINRRANEVVNCASATERHGGYATDGLGVRPVGRRPEIACSITGVHRHAVDEDLHGRRFCGIGRVVNEDLDMRPGVVLQLHAVQLLPVVGLGPVIVNVHAQDRVGRVARVLVRLVLEVDGRLDIARGVKVRRVGRGIGADEVEVRVDERLAAVGHGVVVQRIRVDGPRQVVALRVELDAVVAAERPPGEVRRVERVRDVRLVAVLHRPEAGEVGLLRAVLEVVVR